MAESDEVKQPTTAPIEGGGEKKELKYLEFVQAAAIYMIVCFSSLYDYAKENSGPLKPGVKTVEATVRAVVGPVYRKFHDVPFELLRLVDCKVDESIGEFDRHAPPELKHFSHQLLSAAQKAPEVARWVASELQRAGLVDGAKSISQALYKMYEPTAKEFYFKYEPLGEQYAVSAWRSLNQLPLFPQVAQIIIPTAAYWCEKYNEAVAYTARRGYTVSHYLPAVPIDRIRKLFQSEPAVSSNGETLAVSTST